MPTQDQTTQTPSPSPETNPVVIGGIADGVTITAPEIPGKAAETTPAAPAKKYTLNGREFDSAELALAYAEGVSAQPVQVAQAAAPAAPAASAKVNPADLLFSDPGAAIAAIEENAVQRIRNETAQRNNHQKVWDDFYAANTDLKGFEDEVETQRAKHFKTFEKMNLEDAKKFLATEVRARLAKIRGNANPGEQLPSKPATVAGASGTTASATPTNAAPKVLNFIDEVKGMQSKRGKSA